jgi:hypothetical protein
MGIPLELFLGCYNSVLDPILGFEVFIGVRDSLMDRKNCTPPKLHGTVSIWFWHLFSLIGTSLQIFNPRPSLFSHVHGDSVYLFGFRLAHELHDDFIYTFMGSSVTSWIRICPFGSQIWLYAWEEPGWPHILFNYASMSMYMWFMLHNTPWSPAKLHAWWWGQMHPPSSYN